MANRYDYSRMGTRFDRGLDYPDYGQGPLTPRGYYDRPLTRRFDWETGPFDRPFTRPIEYDYEAYDYGTEPGYMYSETWWWIPGPFTGLGPEGYQRSDDRILEDINDRLLQHGNIDARNIQVGVKKCEVTLKGNVPDRRTKRLAEDVAESVPGVTDVHNELHILNKTGQTTSGQWQEMQHRPMPRRDQLRPGLTVTGLEGKKIGKIKEVRDTDFLLDRNNGPDLYVPFNAVHLMDDGTVMFNFTSDQIEQQNWFTPETIGAGTSGRR